MIIDEVNISAFKLKVLKLEGFYDLPARKETSSEKRNEAKDIVLKEKVATVILLGKYDDAFEMLDQLNDFETLIKSGLKHDITLIGHDQNFIGVFKNGFETIAYYGGKILKLIVPITITE